MMTQPINATIIHDLNWIEGWIPIKIIAKKIPMAKIVGTRCKKKALRACWDTSTLSLQITQTIRGNKTGRNRIDR